MIHSPLPFRLSNESNKEVLCHHLCLIVPLPTSILGDPDIVGQFYAVRNAGLDTILSILALRRLLDIDWNGNVGVEQPLLV